MNTKQKTIKQQLAQLLHGLKPHAPQTEMMVGQNWTIKIDENEAAQRSNQDLADVKKHIKDKFEQQVRFLIQQGNTTREKAEAEAFETAKYRIQSWNCAY